MNCARNAARLHVCASIGRSAGLISPVDLERRCSGISSSMVGCNATGATVRSQLRRLEQKKWASFSECTYDSIARSDIGGIVDRSVYVLREACGGEAVLL